ncbi:unnamed protein product [Fructobacillus tropaeoli]|uniref:hypothetical protein n=1 Tax=Fructobacillus tropaeoli TaxID=709323 RepID=UPI002DAE1F86|nr:unnamed protein product [Fructobacillus tropaeoli]
MDKKIVIGKSIEIGNEYLSASRIPSGTVIRCGDEIYKVTKMVVTVRVYSGNSFVIEKVFINVKNNRRLIRIICLELLLIILSFLVGVTFREFIF